MLDTRSSREGGGHGDVEGREDHQGGDVNCDDQLQVFSIVQVVGGLVDDVHQDGGQVGDGEDGGKVSAQLHFNDNAAVSSRSESHLVYFVLTHLLNARRLNAKMMM